MGRTYGERGVTVGVGTLSIAVTRRPRLPPSPFMRGAYD